MHEIVYNKKTNKYRLIDATPLQETKSDASMLLFLLQPTQTKFKQQPQQQQ